MAKKATETTQQPDAKQYVLAQGVAFVVDKDGLPLGADRCPFTADALTVKDFETYWNRADIVCRGDMANEANAE